jgi:hypothetical protein
MSAILINVRAEVHNSFNGIVTLAVPVQPMAPETAEMLEMLFPHNMERIHSMLNAEALIAAITEQVIPTKGKPEKKSGNCFGI